MVTGIVLCRAAKDLLEARKKAAEEEAKQQQERRTLAILRHRQLFMQVRTAKRLPHARRVSFRPCAGGVG